MNNLAAFSEMLRKTILPMGGVVLIVVFTVVGSLNLKAILEGQQRNNQNLPASLEFVGEFGVSAQVGYRLAVAAEDFNKLPKKLPIYSMKSTLTEQEFSALGSKLGLSPSLAGGNNNFQIIQGNRALKYNDDLKVISYRLDTRASFQKGIKRTEEELRGDTRQFIQSLQITNADIKVNKISYLLDEVEHTDNIEGQLKPEEAQIAAVTFSYLIGDFPVVQENTIAFDAQGKVISFALRPLNVGEKKDEYTLHNYQDIERMLRAQHVQVVSLEIDLEQAVAQEVVREASFEQLSLGYVSQPKHQLAQPVYLLMGKALVGSQPVDVQAVVPAIKGVQIKP